MKRFVALAVALMMAVMVGSPALAQTGANVAGRSGTVDVTFELRLSGEVPGWQNFSVEHYVDGRAEQTPLCTTGADVGPAGPWCKAGGVYTASIEVPAGAPVSFDFIRHDTRTAPERFLNGTRTFAGDTTVAASYDFSGKAPVVEPAVGSTAVADTTAGTTAGTTDVASGVTTGAATTVPAPVPAQTPAGNEAPVVASGESAVTAIPAAVSGGTTAASVASSASGNASGSVVSGSAASGLSGGLFSGAAKVLPDTGGALPLLAVLGCALLVAGLVIRKKI